jgi:tetratricopeptide (TPR) repeat protein
MFKSKLIILSVFCVLKAGCSNPSDKRETKSELHYRIAMDTYRRNFFEHTADSSILGNQILFNLNKAIFYDSNNFRAYQGKLMVLTSMRKYTEAIDLCDNLIRRNRNLIPLYLNRGLILEKMGDKVKAKESYVLAGNDFFVKRGGDSTAKYRVDYCMIRYLIGDSIGALSLMEKGREMNPRSIPQYDFFINLLKQNDRNEILNSTFSTLSD